MRICIVSPRLYHYLNEGSETAAGGSQRQQYLIATELQRRGYEISALVADYDQPAETTYQGIQTYKGVPEYISSPVKIPFVLHSLFGLIRKSEAELFYVRGAPKLATAVSLFTNILGKKFAFGVANDTDLNPEYLQNRYNPVVRRAYSRAVHSADAIIIQTEYQQTQLQTHFSRSGTQISNGYPIPDGNELIPHSERETVLWVGSSDPSQKKPLRFLELAKSLPDISFKMISKPKTDDSSFHGELKSRAEQISNLDFVGEVPPNEIHDYYRAAALFVNTSDYEGFPNTFLEAWRYETPVLSLHHDVDDVLSDGTAGALVGSQEKLMHLTKELMRNKSKRAELGNSARNHMVENYSIEQIVDEYERVFQSLV